jgi:D-xylose transport system ATP-binding protein
MESIRIEFPGVLAVDQANINIEAGEVRAIVGENGAGKSTLMKILSGVYANGSYTGQIRIDGKAVTFNGVSDAERNGITMVPQELNLVDELSVAENLFLNQLPATAGIVNQQALYSKAQEILTEIGLDVSPTIKVKELGVAQKQMIVIGKALGNQVKVLILDEPTSTLSDLESKILFEKIREFKHAGIACLYISHRLEEVLSICDSVTVMRDGRIIQTSPTREMNEQKIVSLMIGRDLNHYYPPITRQPEKIKLSVRDYSVYDLKLPDRKVVDNVSFDLRAGEILGVFGLVGAGRTELAMGLIGAWQGKTEGRCLIDNKEVHVSNPSEAIRAGLGYLPEDRKRQGIIPDMSVSSNISVSSIDKISNFGVIDKMKEVETNKKFVSDLAIKTATLDTHIKTLSGGNQQKCILARLISVDVDVMILDEPTQGVDVGAKTEIYNLLDQLAKAGKAILLISSDLPEVLGISDRVLVMHQGKLVASLDPQKTNRHQVLGFATLGHDTNIGEDVSG